MRLERRAPKYNVKLSSPNGALQSGSLPGPVVRFTSDTLLLIDHLVESDSPRKAGNTGMLLYR